MLSYRDKIQGVDKPRNTEDCQQTQKAGRSKTDPRPPDTSEGSIPHLAPYMPAPWPFLSSLNTDKTAWTMRIGVGRAVSRKKPGSLIALPSNPRGTAFGLIHEKETNFSLVYVSVICLLLFGVRVRVSFMGVHLVWWPRVPHVEGPHTWFTICCRHLGILTSICTRSSVFLL